VLIAVGRGEVAARTARTDPKPDAGTCVATLAFSGGLMDADSAPAADPMRSVLGTL